MAGGLAAGDRVGAIVFGERALVEVAIRSREIGAVRVVSEIARQNRDLPGTGAASSARCSIRFCVGLSI